MQRTQTLYRRTSSKDCIDLSETETETETQTEQSCAVLTIGWSPMCLQLSH